MTNTIKQNIQKDFAELKRIRDELRVKAHLAKADTRDAIARVEARWPDLEREMKRLDRTSGEAVHAVANATASLISELRRAYRAMTGKEELKDDRSTSSRG